MDILIESVLEGPIRELTKINEIKESVLRYYAKEEASGYKTEDTLVEYDISEEYNHIFNESSTFYLFDSIINENIGSEPSDCLRDIVIILKDTDKHRDNLNEIFQSDTHTRTYNICTHTTLITRFKIKDLEFMCYSNTGSGTECGQYSNETLAVPLFFKINNISGVYSLGFIESTWYFNNESRNDGHVDKYWSDVLKSTNSEANWYTLVYSTLQLFDNRGDITECSYESIFNYYINDEAYKELPYFTKLYDEKRKIAQQCVSLVDIYDINLSSPERRDWLEINEKPEFKEEPNSVLEDRINEFNSKIQRYSKYSKTLGYKLLTFKLEYIKGYGLVNNLQLAGTCSFSCFYNFMINFLFLYYSNVDDFIESFINIHFRFLYLYCLSNDLANDKFSFTQYTNLSYCYNAVEKEFKDEICEFYKSPTSIFQKNKLVIDVMRNYRVTDIKIEDKKAYVLNKAESTSNTLVKLLYKYIQTARDRNVFNERQFISEYESAISINKCSFYCFLLISLLEALANNSCEFVYKHNGPVINILNYSCKENENYIDVIEKRSRLTDLLDIFYLLLNKNELLGLSNIFVGLKTTSKGEKLDKHLYIGQIGCVIVSTDGLNLYKLNEDTEIVDYFIVTWFILYIKSQICILLGINPQIAESIIMKIKSIFKNYVKDYDKTVKLIQNEADKIYITLSEYGLESIIRYIIYDLCIDFSPEYNYYNLLTINKIEQNSGNLVDLKFYYDLDSIEQILCKLNDNSTIINKFNMQQINTQEYKAIKITSVKLIHIINTFIPYNKNYMNLVIVKKNIIEFDSNFDFILLCNDLNFSLEFYFNDNKLSEVFINFLNGNRFKLIHQINFNTHFMKTFLPYIMYKDTNNNKQLIIFNSNEFITDIDNSINLNPIKCSVFKNSNLSIELSGCDYFLTNKEFKLDIFKNTTSNLYNLNPLQLNESLLKYINNFEEFDQRITQKIDILIDLLTNKPNIIPKIDLLPYEQEPDLDFIHSRRKNKQLIIFNFNKLIIKIVNDIIINFNKIHKIAREEEEVKQDFHNEEQPLDEWDIKNMINILNNIRAFIIPNINNFNILELLFMIQANFFIKETQYKTYINILANLDSAEPNLLNQVHQFMLGGGKTSVITPLLALNLKLIKNKDILIITLEHLVEQTKSNFSYLCYLLNIENNFVDSVEEYKKKFILDDISIRGKILIIDEFDNMFDANNSLFNYIDSRSEENREEKINIDQFKDLFSRMIGSEIENLEKNRKLIECFEIIINKCSKLIYKDNYGFLHKVESSYIKNKIRFCIPFARKDTPIKNSNFSSILIPIFLTFKEYLKNKFDEDDAINLIYHIDQVTNIFSYNEQLYREIINIIMAVDLNQSTKIEQILKVINSDPIPIIPHYLYHINKSKFNIPTNQLNMSFQDIILNRYSKKQVGYTGTINGIKLTQTSFSIYDTNLKPDPSITENYILAMSGSRSDDFIDKVHILDAEMEVGILVDFILDKLNINKRAGFVDLAGLFINYDNKTIAKILQKKMPEMKIIYFSLDHKTYNYIDDNNSLEFKKPSNNDFYYYDKAHVIGTDILQKRIGHFIVLINDKTRETDFIQAIFRFRKLNQGTYMNIIKVVKSRLEVESSVNLKNADIIKMLSQNELNYYEKQQQKIQLQLLKALVRNQTHNHRENNIKQFFELTEHYNCEEYLCDYLLGLNDDHRKISCILSNEVIRSIYEGIKANLKELLFDNIDSIEIVLSNEQAKEQEKEQDQERNRIIDIYSSKENGVASSIQPLLLYHLNCDYCYKNTMVRIFEINDLNKPIYYLSYNLRYSFSINNILLCLVKIEKNIYMLEYKSICDFYYFNKLPVYDIIGNLLNPDRVSDGDMSNIDIDNDIILLFNFKTSKFDIHRKNIKLVYKKLNITSKLLLKNYFTNYFSKNLKKTYNEPEISIMSNLYSDNANNEQKKPIRHISELNRYKRDFLPYLKPNENPIHDIIGGTNNYTSFPFIIILILLILLIIYIVSKLYKKDKYTKIQKYKNILKR